MPTDDQPHYHDLKNTTEEEEHSFDKLAKGLAASTLTRGKVLKLAGAAFLGSFFGGLLFGLPASEAQSQGGGGGVGGGGGAHHRHRHHHHHRHRVHCGGGHCPRGSVCAIDTGFPGCSTGTVCVLSQCTSGGVPCTPGTNGCCVRGSTCFERVAGGTVCSIGLTCPT